VWYERLILIFAGIALVGLLTGYALRERWSRLAHALWFTVGVLPVVLWFLLPQALPVPPIDVYSFHESASNYLAKGINPYSVVLGTPTFFVEPAGYVYPPGVLYPISLSFLLSGDVRYGQALLMFATSVLLWLIVRRLAGNRSAIFAALLFLYHPRAIHVLGHSYTEVIIGFPFALFIFLAVYRFLPAAAALVYGYFISLKPYLIPLSLSWLIIERRPRYLALGIVGALVPVIPFLGSDLVGTVNNGFLFNMNGPFRSDSLTLVAFFKELCDCTLPKNNWSLLIALSASIITFWFFRHRSSLPSYLYAATISLFSMLFLGSQAFANYYYFLSVMLLFLVVVCSGRATRSDSAFQRFGL
jgi:hypothetical protein